MEADEGGTCPILKYRKTFGTAAMLASEQPAPTIYINMTDNGRGNAATQDRLLPQQPTCFLPNVLLAISQKRGHAGQSSRIDDGCGWKRAIRW